MFVQSCNTSTGEAEAGDPAFKASLGYIVRPCLKKKDRKTIWMRYDKQKAGNLISVKAINNSFNG
jgi:hypothetical protein